MVGKIAANVLQLWAVAVLELLTIQIQQMTIESTNDKQPTAPAITYSECYVHVAFSIVQSKYEHFFI